jgi:signal transduction histidine kinase
VTTIPGESQSRADVTEAPASGPPTVPPGADRLERLHLLLTGGLAGAAKPVLEQARARAETIRAAVGDAEGASTVTASAFAADVLVALAIEGGLDGSGTQLAAAAVADAAAIDLEAARFDVFSRAVGSSQLLELPPLVGAGIQLRLLADVGVTDDVSLWRREPDGELECLMHLGEAPTRRMRSQARAALRQRRVRGPGRSSVRSHPIQRFGRPIGAVVARGDRQTPARIDAYLRETTSALAGLLEREYLLERSGARERALVSASERRLMRLGFDLHDGPIQDVLALAAEVRHLRDQANPHVLESHREQVFGRFDDVLLRLVELDRQLREIAHSLESRSIVSRPLAEILNREVQAFGDRTDIAVQLELRGDTESLTSAQRVAVFRAIQEGLANVREHSGATHVEIGLRARRSSVDVRIADNGAGFEVSRALARAAQGGRLGLVGIGERVRMLGGTFDINSAPGGPTVLAFSLPRWTPLAPPPER